MLYQDKPEDTDELRFGHAGVSAWLAELLLDLPLPFRLALTGGLGTGKSTILRNALKNLKNQRPTNKTKIVNVDVWKLDKESVRRSAILKIAKELGIDPRSSGILRENLYGNFSSSSSHRPGFSKLDRSALPIATFLSLAVGLGIYFALGILNQGKDDEFQRFIIALILAGVNFGARFIEKSVVYVQRTFTRPPLVGAEEFEESLQEVLSQQKDDTLIIIVFDNIDRASPESSKAILTGISAFFDHSEEAKMRNLLIVVPFDKDSNDSNDDSGRTLMQDAEKMFDAAVSLPTITDDDLANYALELVSKSLGAKYTNSVYQEIATLVSFSPFRSPREIKHLVNDIVSQLSLAAAMETTSDLRIGPATLLPIGSVTAYPSALSKLIISEKICPGLMSRLVERATDLRDFLNKETLPSGIRQEAGIFEEALAAFYRSTASLLAGSIPPSAAPFHFKKGPDALISIPSGMAFTTSLTTANPEEILRITENGQNPSAVSDLFKVAEYQLSKYGRNDQVIKNTTRAIVLAVKNFSPQLNLNQAEFILALIARQPAASVTLSPLIIHSTTALADGGPLHTKTWKVIDKHFKVVVGVSDFAIGTDQGNSNWEWCVDYLRSITMQKIGFERSDIQAGSLPFLLLLDQRVLDAMGRSLFMQIISPDQTAAATAKFVVSEEPENALTAIVQDKFSTLDGTISFDSIALEWQNVAARWISPNESNAGWRLKTVLANWPLGNQKSMKGFIACRDWFANRSTQLIQIAKSGRADEVIALAVEFYKLQSSSGDLVQIIQFAVSNVELQQYERLRHHQDLADAFSILIRVAPTEFKAMLDRLMMFGDFFSNASGPDQLWLISQFPSLGSKVAFLEDARRNLSKIAISDQLNGLHIALRSDEERIEFLRLLKDIGISSAQISLVLVDIVKRPLNSTEAVLVEIDTLFNRHIPELLNLAWLELSSRRQRWTALQVEQLKIALKNPTELTSDRLTCIIDVAIERGISTTPEIKDAIASIIVKLWKRNVGRSEKHLRIMLGISFNDEAITADLNKLKLS